MKLDFTNYTNIPDRTKESLQNYIEFGYHPGGFVMAALSNNLSSAFAHADIENERALKELTMFMYNKLPSNVWGSEQKVYNFLKTFT